MSWNYRVVRTEFPATEYQKANVRWAIHEVYYDNDGMDTSPSWTEDPVGPEVWESELDGRDPVDCLREDLNRQLHDLSKPVIDGGIYVDK